MMTSTERVTAACLREVADWLDGHPDETVSWAGVGLSAGTRQDMVRIAGALGDGTSERLTFGRDVEIAKTFGAVTVYATVPVSVLQPDSPPAPPEWERILPTPMSQEAV